MPCNVHFEQREPTGRLLWARFLVAGSREWHCEELPNSGFVPADRDVARTHSELEEMP